MIRGVPITSVRFLLLSCYKAHLETEKHLGAACSSPQHQIGYSGDCTSSLGVCDVSQMAVTLPIGVHSAYRTLQAFLPSFPPRFDLANCAHQFLYSLITISVFYRFLSAKKTTAFPLMKTPLPLL